MSSMSFPMYDGIKSKYLLYFQWRFTGHMSWGDKPVAAQDLRGIHEVSTKTFCLRGWRKRHTHSLDAFLLLFSLFFISLFLTPIHPMTDTGGSGSGRHVEAHSRSKRHSGVWSLGNLPTQDFNCRAPELENFTYLSAENSLSNNYML